MHVYPTIKEARAHFSKHARHLMNDHARACAKVKTRWDEYETGMPYVALAECHFIGFRFDEKRRVVGFYL